MLASQKLAIAAHLHVLLRRKTGRVTDTEWMASNLEYALEIIRFSRAKAREDGHPDLDEWAGKLEMAMLEAKPAAAKPLAQSALQMLRERSAASEVVVTEPAVASGFSDSVNAESGFLESAFGAERPRKQREPAAPRYVGGIR